MADYKRKFYLIAHNPNSIELAREFLRLGANALEPDIVYRKKRFFVTDVPSLNPHPVPLEDYLTGLRQLLADFPKLALITFDLKNVNYDINILIRIVREYLTDDVAAGVTIIYTHASNVSFVNKYDQTAHNTGIGVDQSRHKPSHLHHLLKEAGQKNFIYANGSITIIPDLAGTLIRDIMLAKNMQVTHGEQSFKIIYAWILERESTLEAHLNLHVDGIIVNLDLVNRLRTLLEGKFKDRYELAPRGYLPFDSPFPPLYNLTILTSQRNMAGTNTQVKFTLTNTDGISLSAVLDGKQPQVMETGDADFLTLEGIDLGHSIKSLTIEAMTKGKNSGWLPSAIIVSSSLLPAQIVFTYGKDEWLSFKDNPRIVHEVPSAPIV